VGSDGSWNPRSELLPAGSRPLHVAVPAASAALIVLS